MKLAHLADLHLGFRQFDRITSAGVNQREADVAATFARVIDRLIAIAPDVVLIGGDVFHTPRPTNHTILTAFSEFGRLTRALPNAILVVAAGNHDLSRSIEGPTILQLLTALGIHVADRAAKRFFFPALDLSILAVPDAPGVARPEIVPDPRARTNLLVLHGEVQGMLPHRREISNIEISHEELGVSAWTYIALGHWHTYRELAPNLFYSGSIDFTSSNPWSETSVPKGFIERDLETGAHTFHELAPSRRYVELPAIDAAGLGAADVDARIAAALEGAAIDGQVARLVVHNIDREVSHALDHRGIRSARRRALNFNLDLRRPDRVARAPIASSYAALRNRSLEDILQERLGSRELTNDVDRQQLQQRAAEYLALAGEQEADRAGMESAAVAALEPVRGAA